jgi:exodeoxyribonuclease-1
MAPSFFFFDLETFGLDPRYDRVAQFAGLRTDEDFEPVGERLILYCKPTPDYLPSPLACLVHGITPQAAAEAGRSEYQLARAILAEMSVPSTTSLGYNTIQFDDEFLRHLFYRCFFDPYAREYKRGNSRWDLLDLMRAAHDLRPEGLVWPAEADGRPIVKLEALAKANGVDQGAAHDAMHDVLATIGLARLVKRRQPKLFDWYYSHRTRDSLRPLVDLAGRSPLVHTSAAYTSPRGCTTLVAPISIDPENRNQLLALDLRFDPAEVVDLPVEELRRRVFTKADELEVPRLPLSRIRLNRSPFLAPQSTLSEAAAARLGIDLDACAAHLERIRREPELIQKLSSVFSGPLATKDQDDPEFRLYSDGFFPDEDSALFSKIHGSLEVLPPAEAKAKAYRCRFRDERAAQMLRRFFARNFPETLEGEEARRWKSFCASRLQLPPSTEATDLGSYAKLISQRLEDPATPARDRGILLALLSYKAGLEDEVLGYKGA